MENIIEAITKIVPEGTDITSVKELIAEATRNPLDSIVDRESAEKFIRDNSALNSFYDSGISKAIESHKSKFEKEKLPEIRTNIRQELLKELRPEETEAQKLAREFEEYKQGQQQKEALSALRTELVKSFDTLKAHEVGFSVSDLDNYVGMGENAIEVFAKNVERFKAIKTAAVEEALKDKYKATPPEAGDKPQERDHWKGINTDWINK